MRHLARHISALGMTKVLSAPAEGWRNFNAFSITIYRGALGIAALVTLVVAVRWVLKAASSHPSGTDDSRVIMYTGEILRNPGSWIFEIELPLLQYLSYASLVKLFGWGMPLVLVPLLFSVALALLVGYIAHRVAGGPWAFLAAALALASLPVFLLQARSLPFDRERLVLGRLGKMYAAVAGLTLPWFVWHLTVGGLAGLRQQQMNWQIERGYQRIRNIEFWGTQTDSRIDFVENLPRMLEDAAGPLIFVLAGLCIVGLIRLPSWSWRAAALIALAIPFGTLVYAAPAIYARYIYSVLPAVVLLSVYGFHGLLRWVSSGRLTVHLARMVAIATVALLGTVFVQHALDQMNTIDRTETLWGTGELPLITALVDDDKAVLGSRVLPLTRYKPENALLSLGFMSEDDAVTYLLWPSDGTVEPVLQRNDVGWVLIAQPAETWERDYNLWLRNAAGQLPSHYLKIEDSELAEKVYDGPRYSLYRITDSQVSEAR